MMNDRQQYFEEQDDCGINADGEQNDSFLRFSGHEEINVEEDEGE